MTRLVMRIAPSFLRLLGVATTLAACSDDPSGGRDAAIPAPDAGVDAALDAAPEPGWDAGPEPDVRGIFVVPREGDDGAPWDLPFPSDLLRGERGVGIDLSRFPNPTGWEPVTLLVDLLREEVDGFSTAGTAYLRFSAPLDPASLPAPAATLEAASPVFLVALDTGERVPIEMRFQERATDYWGENTLAVRAVNGFVLAPATRYALVATTALTDAAGSHFAAANDLRAALGLVDGDRPTDDAHERVYGPAAERLAALGTAATDIASLAVFTTMDPVGPMFRAAEALRRDIAIPEAGGLSVDQSEETFTLLSGRYEPAPIYQDGEAPYEELGSGRIRFRNGEPVLQDLVELRFAVAVPTSEMPASGYPIVITSHGTGGDFESFAADGTAGRLAAVGVASIGFDQVLHGERAPPGTSPENTVFNFLNPVAGRDNVRQSALDNVQQVRLVEDIVILSSRIPNDGDAFFDPDRIAFFGHSQGGLNGSLLLAIDDTAQAAVLSGTGALIGWAILQKTQPTAILPLIEAALDIDAETEGFDIFHPLLMVTQTFIDPSDPVSYAPFWSAPRVGNGRSVLLTEGMEDDFAPPLGTEAIAVAARLPIVGTVEQFVPGLELLGLSPVDLPASGTVTSSTGEPLTSGLWQIPDHGHFAVYDEPGLAEAAPAFLASALSTPPGTIALP